MIDLRLPKPLMEPEAWSAGDEPALFDLRFALTAGGPLETAIARRSAVAFTIGPMNRIDQAIVADRARGLRPGATFFATADADPWLLDRLRTGGHRLEPLCREMEAKAPSSLDWAHEVFSRSRTSLDDLTWRRLIGDFVKARGEDVRSLDDLRLFPTLSKAKLPGPVHHDLERDLARALALFSPQKEASGLGLIVNPTVQIVSNEKMTAYFRSESKLRELDVDWQMAALIDELEESPRLGREALLQKVAAETAGGPLPRSREFEDVLDALVREGLVLG